MALVHRVDLNHVQQMIWQAVAQIPAGQVTSYGTIAKDIGFPNHARYVGATLKKLPSDSRLPWHRVLNSKGAIAFAKGTPQYQEQRLRLEQEGVVFIEGRAQLVG